MENEADKQGQTEQPDGVPAAVQARIDEINSQFRESQRLNQQLVAQNNELVARLTSASQRREPEPEVPTFHLPEGVDPTQAKLVQDIAAAAVEQATAPLKKQLAELGGSMQRTTINARDAASLAAIAPQLQKINNPLVTARVHELMNLWRNDPEQKFAHATPEDALLIATGQASLGLLGEQVQNRDERGRFNSNANVLPGAGGRSQSTTTQPKQRPVEERLREVDLNRMTRKQLQQLNAELDAKYPDGIPIGG